MNTRTLTVERTTSTAHRLVHYDGVCGNIHGHNMRWEVTAEVNMSDVDESNMPVDFKEISDIIDRVDHAVILNEKDPLVSILEDPEATLGSLILFNGDPTCEVLAKWMADEIVSGVKPVIYTEVTLSETEKYGVTTSAYEPGES